MLGVSVGKMSDADHCWIYEHVEDGIEHYILLSGKYRNTILPIKERLFCRTDVCLV